MAVTKTITLKATSKEHLFEVRLSAGEPIAFRILSPAGAHEFHTMELDPDEVADLANVFRQARDLVKRKPKPKPKPPVNKNEL